MQMRTPSTMAMPIVERKERAPSCAIATGMTMRALTRSEPTTRIATATVRADRMAMRRDSVRTGSPVERAKSSSLVTEKSAGASPTPRIVMSVMSLHRTVEIDPNR